MKAKAGHPASKSTCVTAEARAKDSVAMQGRHLSTLTIGTRRREGREAQVSVVLYPSMSTVLGQRGLQS